MKQQEDACCSIYRFLFFNIQSHLNAAQQLRHHTRGEVMLSSSALNELIKGLYAEIHTPSEMNLVDQAADKKNSNVKFRHQNMTFSVWNLSCYSLSHHNAEQDKQSMRCCPTFITSKLGQSFMYERNPVHVRGPPQWQKLPLLFQIPFTLKQLHNLFCAALCHW